MRLKRSIRKTTSGKEIDAARIAHCDKCNVDIDSRGWKGHVRSTAHQNKEEEKKEQAAVVAVVAEEVSIPRRFKVVVISGDEAVLVDNGVTEPVTIVRLGLGH